MIALEEAQRRLLALAKPVPAETLPLHSAAGRCAAADIIAHRTQPVRDLSAMDGYAVRFADGPGPWRLIGQSAAGAAFSGAMGPGDTVRIFTGAHVPQGADHILIQEDTTREGDTVTVGAMIATIATTSLFGTRNCRNLIYIAHLELQAFFSSSLRCCVAGTIHRRQTGQQCASLSSPGADRICSRSRTSLGRVQIA